VTNGLLQFVKEGRNVQCNGGRVSGLVTSGVGTAL
jgi:hypothetical protein